MISTKEQGATRAELRAVEVVRPDWLGDRWVGIQHGKLVDTIHEQLDARKLKQTNEQWFVSGRYDGKLVGSMEIKIPKMKAPKGTSFSLGVLHSNLGDIALKFAVGAKIFVCSNGMVSGDYMVKRKHTKGVELDEIVGLGIDRYLEEVGNVSVAIEKMKEKELKKKDVDRVLMQAGRDKLMPWSRIGQVDAEYRKPTFADHAEQRAWALYSAFTYIVQKCPPHQQIDSISKFRTIVTN